MDQTCWLSVPEYKKRGIKRRTWKPLWSLEDGGILQFSKLNLIQSSTDKTLWEYKCYNCRMPAIHHQQGKQDLDLKLLEVLRFFFWEKKRGKIIQVKRTGCNSLGNDYSRTQAVQQIISMCQWHPVDVEKSSEEKVFLNFILINTKKMLEKVKYSLGRNDDGMTEFMTLVKGRQENSEEK